MNLHDLEADKRKDFFCRTVMMGEKFGNVFSYYSMIQILHGRQRVVGDGGAVQVPHQGRPQGPGREERQGQEWKQESQTS